MNKVRYVVWSADMAHVALLGKHGECKMGFGHMFKDGNFLFTKVMKYGSTVDDM